MVVRLRARRRRGRASRRSPGRDVRFHADDRLEPRLLRLFLELPGRVQVAVVGDREGRLLEFQRLAIRSSIRFAPSRREYSEWQWRWTKDT